MARIGYAGVGTNEEDLEVQLELLNKTLFPSLSHARAMLQAWRNDYNLNRPHSRLGWLTPTEYADTLKIMVGVTGTPPIPLRY